VADGVGVGVVQVTTGTVGGLEVVAMGESDPVALGATVGGSAGVGVVVTQVGGTGTTPLPGAWW
jgi:hypothetical protein